MPIRHVLFGSGYVSLFSWLFAREKLTCLNLELRVPLPLRKDMVLQLKLNETFSAACENSRLPLGKFRQGGNVPSGEELSNNYSKMEGSCVFRIFIKENINCWSE